ncbi:hypothetical protein BHE74_00048698 [Ensete ventricosum]|nr:hypothetical protein BHE74_00048698 [Ensete ventricosum]RZS07005.1 hypothetical protein BHM03_00037766 [Ensete ventricosum]
MSSFLRCVKTVVSFRRRSGSFLRCVKTVVSFLRRLFHCGDGRKPDPRPWDPPFDPSQPSIPISYPITTLEALASRSYFRSFHYPFNRSSVPLPPSAAALPPRRRILVCHDMKGGYTDDLWVQGGDNPDAYAIWHWHLMDVFVYFSHYLVTLPPPCWTNAAHTHGVKVLPPRFLIRALVLLLGFPLLVNWRRF